MDRNKLAFLLPIRSVLFILIFIFGSRIIGKSLSDISNWWTTIATAVNIFTIILLILVSKKNDMTYLELINYKKEKRK